MCLYCSAQCNGRSLILLPPLSSHSQQQMGKDLRGSKLSFKETKAPVPPAAPSTASLPILDADGKEVICAVCMVRELDLHSAR